MSDVDASRAIERFHVLLSDRGEISAERLAGDALAAYESLTGPSLDTFFTFLSRQFSADAGRVERCADALRRNPSPESLAALQAAIESPRRELFQRLNLAPGATATLVEMRRRVLSGINRHPEWSPVASDLEQLFRSWFNGGFLEFRRIDWHTPTPVLENLIKYEAVHQIRDWAHLKRRLEDDRRCYGFFHPSLPHEPLIFTELALTADMSARVQPILDPESPILDRASRNCAVFYSISSCHDGLRGVSFGNSLIRRVAGSLAREYPRLRTIATLSPIPGFRGWLTRTAQDHSSSARSAAAKLTDAQCFADAVRAGELGQLLLPLCASYLMGAKRGGEPADPVARFHLGNGARLERINWLGDTSEAGMTRSATLTANYLYRLSDVERNHRSYATDGKVIASRAVQKMSHGAGIDPLALAS